MLDTSVKRFDSTQAGATVVGQTAGDLIALLDSVLVSGFGFKTCDSVVIAGGVGTATISTGHSAIPQCVVLFAGATGSYLALNGERKVTAISTSTVIFDADGLPDGTATGTITLKIAPAGWAKVFSGTNKAVYRSADPASTQTYLRVDDSHAQYARPVGYLTMTDIDTGTGAFGADAYWNRTNATAGARPWWVAAGKSFIHFGIQTHGTGAANGYAICAFGDSIPRRSGNAYRAILAGAASPATSWTNADVAMSTLIHQASAGFSVARSYHQLGAGVAAKPMGAYQATVQSGYVATIPFPNGGDNSVVLSQAECAELSNSNLIGRIPGLYLCPQRPNGALLNDFAITNAADFPGKTLLWKLTGSAAASNYGGCAIDVTGPWE